MQSTETSPELSHDELHLRANRYIYDLNQLVSQDLPAVISQIIEHEVWKNRTNPYKHFGEYALNQSPDGLGITNNETLLFLRSAMNINAQHKAHWGDVLGEVDTCVRKYAKKNNISLRELNGTLTEEDTSNPELYQENTITYLPSRSKSLDGQLLKLKKKDPHAYDEVVQGKMNLKEAWPQAPRKKLEPIESVKNKFSSLSKAERLEFLAWIEQEKANLE